MVPEQTVTIVYVNWQGVRRERKIIPIRLEYTATEFHKEVQWLLEAIDIEDNNKIKKFAMKDIHSWRP